MPKRLVTVQPKKVVTVSPKKDHTASKYRTTTMASRWGRRYVKRTQRWFGILNALRFFFTLHPCRDMKDL
ncbi:MAG: hypothetical protein WCZ43_07215 [Proteiniphilum sp.]